MPNMTCDQSDVSRAEEFKLQANDAFRAHKYALAIDLYTKAIDLNQDNVVYLANCAFVHTKLEEYGSAMQDASKAIEGYYWKGAAYLSMGKFKDALKDFQQLKKICPNDPDATKKLKECEKAVMKLKFEEAIAVPESERCSVADSIDFSSIGLMCEILWSDPQPLPGRGPSKRGVGLSFGADVTKRFLQDNCLDLVVRSHEVKDEGYEIEHEGKLITVFLTPNYCDQMGNKGAFIRFEAPDLKPDIVTFSPVPHRLTLMSSQWNKPTTSCACSSSKNSSLNC